jgi:hypothetical protein
MANHPTRYELAGGDIHVIYKTTSVTGQPTFDYNDAVLVRSFTGDQIKSVLTTDIGTLVTVEIHLTLEASTTTFSVLLPNVNLEPSSSGVLITAEGITTRHRFPIVPVEGPTQFYTVHEMDGRAQHLVF